MGQLLRLLIILVGLWLVLRIIKQALTSRSKTPSRRKPAITNMVECAHCGLHLPESEALMKENKYFCGEEHLQAAKQRKR
jgi:uncharacterized protein